VYNLHRHHVTRRLKYSLYSAMEDDMEQELKFTKPRGLHDTRSKDLHATKKCLVFFILLGRINLRFIYRELLNFDL
jgi:hypothetical protein